MDAHFTDVSLDVSAQNESHEGIGWGSEDKHVLAGHEFESSQYTPANNSTDRWAAYQCVRRSVYIRDGVGHIEIDLRDAHGFKGTGFNSSLH